MASVERRKRKDGRFSYRIIISEQLPDGTRKKTHISWEPPAEAKTKAQVEKALRSAVAEAEALYERGYRPTARTFAEYATAYIEKKEKQGAIRRRTAARYRELLVRINQAMGHLLMTQIRPDHLNSFYANLKEAGIRDTPDRARLLDGVNLHELIRAAGFSSFEKLAAAASMNAKTVSLACAGKRVYAESAKKIAKAVGLPLESLFEVEKDERPLSNKTVLEYHRLISSVFAQAEAEGAVKRSPCRQGMILPRAKAPNPQFFDREEFSQIVRAIDTDPQVSPFWRAVFYFMADTGARREEVIGLAENGVDLDAGIVYISQSVQHLREYGTYIDETKNESSVRYLAISEVTVAAMRAWKEKKDEFRKAYGADWIDNNLFFTSKTGEKINPDSVTGYFRRFYQKHGLPKIYPHKFQHTAASLLIGMGVDTVAVAAELGHSSPATTQKVYAHAISEARARAGKLRGSVFKTIEKGEEDKDKAK